METGFLVSINSQLLAAGLAEIVDYSANNLETFHRLLHRHGIASRIVELRAIFEHSLGAARWAIVEGLVHDAIQSVNNYERTLKKILSLSSARRRIVVKGSSVLWNLGGKDTRHRSRADVDILTTDPDDFKRSAFVNASNGICHEYGTWRLEDSGLLDVDLHRYIPSWDISRPGSRFGAISLQDLSPFLHHSENGVYYPDPTGCAVIAAAHAYRNFVEHPAWSEGCLKLVEVLEYDEMTRHPGFDKARFDSIMITVDGLRSVKFLSAACKAILGHPNNTPWVAEI